MSERPLAAGEIGVLCENTTNPCGMYKNDIVEVVGVKIYKGMQVRANDYYIFIHPLIKSPDIDGSWSANIHQIRRISNPDAEQSTEREKVVVV